MSGALHYAQLLVARRFSLRVERYAVNDSLFSAVLIHFLFLPPQPITISAAIGVSYCLYLRNGSTFCIGSNDSSQSRLSGGVLRTSIANVSNVSGSTPNS